MSSNITSIESPNALVFMFVAGGQRVWYILTFSPARKRLHHGFAQASVFPQSAMLGDDLFRLVPSMETHVAHKQQKDHVGEQWVSIAVDGKTVNAKLPGGISYLKHAMY